MRSRSCSGCRGAEVGGGGPGSRQSRLSRAHLEFGCASGDPVQAERGPGRLSGVDLRQVPSSPDRMRRVALSSDETAVKDSANGAPISAGSLFCRGLLIHLSNPKSVLAWIALMTLGLGPGASWHTVTTILGGCILGGCAILSVTIFCGYALCSQLRR